jgi:hypothetical protein
MPYLTLGAPFPQTNLQAYYAGLQQANATIDATRFEDPDILARQQQMMATAFGFLETALQVNAVSNATLAAYTAAVTNSTLANVDKAARVRIDLTHATVTRWRNTLLSKSDWEGFHFVTHSSHMAREGDVGAQYFARVLSDNPAQPNLQPNVPNQRVIFLDDSIMDEGQAVGELGSHMNGMVVWGCG